MHKQLQSQRFVKHSVNIYTHILYIYIYVCVCVCTFYHIVSFVLIILYNVVKWRKTQRKRISQ